MMNILRQNGIRKISKPEKAEEKQKPSVMNGNSHIHGRH